MSRSVKKCGDGIDDVQVSSRYVVFETELNDFWVPWWG